MDDDEFGEIDRLVRFLVRVPECLLLVAVLTAVAWLACRGYR